MKDGEAKTACQQACSGDAIVFGNVHDKESAITKTREENEKRLFYVIEQIHTLPNVNYLAKIRNTDEIIEPGHHEEGAGEEKHEMAKRYARLVAGSRNFAAAASFAAKQKATYDDLCTTLKRYNEDVVKALKAEPGRVEIVNAQFELCAELTAILFSDEEAVMLRRRGKAAQAASAA